VAAKLNELVAEYFPTGGYSVMDGNRLKLAAAHYVDADLCRDPVVRQRATRCAEFLLSKVKRQEGPSPTLEQILAGRGKGRWRLAQRGPSSWSRKRRSSSTAVPTAN